MRITGGRADLNGTDILALRGRDSRRLRGAAVTYVAQSAAAAFNPAYPLIEQVTEATLWHGLMNRSDAIARAKELLLCSACPIRRILAIAIRIRRRADSCSVR